MKATSYGFILMASVLVALVMAFLALDGRLANLERRTEVEFARVRYWNIERALSAVLSCDQTDQENFLAGLRVGVTAEVATWRTTHCPPEGR